MALQIQIGNQHLYEALECCFEKVMDTEGKVNLRAVSLEIWEDECFGQIAREIGHLQDFEKLLHNLVFVCPKSYLTWLSWNELLGLIQDNGIRIERNLHPKKDPVEETKRTLQANFEEIGENLSKVYALGFEEYGKAYAQMIGEDLHPKPLSSCRTASNSTRNKLEDNIQERLKQISLLQNGIAVKDSNRTLMEALDIRMEPKDKHLEDLTEKDHEIVDQGMQGKPFEVVVDAFNIQMLREKLQSLEPGRWLLDEPINFYFQLLEERDKRNCAEDSGRRRNFFMNSFFMNKLVIDNGYNYAGVRRWTKRKKIDIFSGDKVLIPVNVGNMHWCLAVLHIAERKIQYYDSMGGSGWEFLEALKRYIQDEMKDKKNEVLDISEWKLIKTKDDTPQQRNGYDCGVFTCMCADYLSENNPLSFSQDNMSLFRKRIALSILQCHVK